MTGGAPGPYAEACEAYRRAGWTGVLPLPPRRKSPPPDGYTGETGAWPSAADCLAWALGPEGEGNIALRLPYNVVGIDVDDYDGKNGGATLAGAQARYGPLPATWITTSRDDGVSGIRLYRVPEGLAWPGVLGPGSEIIQYHHRYVVIWPSVHPDIGRTYVWIAPDGTRPDAVPDPDALPPLPDAWIQGLTGGREHVDTPRNDWNASQIQAWITSRPLAFDAPCERMARVTSEAGLALAARASAHDTVNAAVMRALRLADEHHAGLITALGQLHAAFVADVTRPGRGGSVRTPAAAEREWRRGLDGAASKVSASSTGLDACDCGGRLTERIVSAAGQPPAGSAHETRPDPIQRGANGTTPIIPGEYHPDPARPGYDPLDVTNPAVEDQIRTETLKVQIRDEARRRVRRQTHGTPDPPALISLGDFLAIPDPPQDYRIEGLWPAGGRVVLAAQFKAGKTTFTANLVRALADGEPFLGRFLVHRPQGRIVVLDNELDENMLRRWLRDQDVKNTAQVYLQTLKGKLSGFDIFDPHIRRQWAAALREAKTSVLIVDCLAPILDSLGLSEDKEAGIFLVALDELAELAGVSEIVLVHHMGHNGERVRGASRLRDWPDVEWRLVREEEDGQPNPAAKRYFSAYGRDVDVSESALDYAGETRRLRLAGGSRAGKGTDAAHHALLIYLAGNQGSSGRAIELALGAEHTRKAIRAGLKAALEGQEITKAQGMRGATLHSLTEKGFQVARGDTPSDLGGELKTPGQGHSAPDLAPVRRNSAGDCASSPGPIGPVARPGALGSPGTGRGGGELDPEQTLIATEYGNIDPRTGEIIEPAEAGP